MNKGSLLLQPIKVGDLTLKNRIMFPPLTTGYEERDGWMCETPHITRIEDLPPKAKAYVDRLVELSGAKLGILSIDPARESTLRIAL